MTYTYDRKKALSNEALNPGKKMTPAPVAKPAPAPAATPAPTTKKKNDTPTNSLGQGMSQAPDEILNAPTQNFTPANQGMSQAPAAMLQPSIVADQGQQSSFTNVTPSASNSMEFVGPPEPNVSVNQPTGLLGAVTGQDYSQLGPQGGSPAGIWAITPATGVTAAISKGLSFVDKSKQVGTAITPNMGGTAGTFLSNEATRAATTTWLSKLVKGTTKAITNPAAVVGGLMAAIGTYPFAGFIKEEALQNTGFAIKTAIESKNLVDAQAAIELQRAMLNPSLWELIKEKVPFVNVMEKLDDYYDSAKLKLNIDEKLVDDLKREVELGETPDEKWVRVTEEQSNQKQADIDYYNQERKKLLEWERQAAEDQRNEDAKFWANEREKKSAQEKADQKATAEYWEKYKQASQKASDDNRPSKLNFGLI